MTPKRIEYDVHANDQMRDRKITRADVRWLLADGVMCEAVFARCGYLRGREAKVVYLENAERVYVVTVMWVLSRAAVEREKEVRKRRKP